MVAVATQAQRSRPSIVVVDAVSKVPLVAAATQVPRSRPSTVVVDAVSNRNRLLEYNLPDAKQTPHGKADHLQRAAAFGGA